MKTAFIIVDLGFGDAGKGGLIDYLAHRQDAHAIVRYTGGPHAAHHVVRPDGTSHAFCQFGATFKAGVHTHLASGVIVKPENLIYEGRALQAKGVSDPFSQLSIDPRCRLVTSYHAMLCQMKELGRGNQRRGTVGIGAGEAVAESEQDPSLALRMGDLFEPERLREKLCLHYERALCQAQGLLRESTPGPVRELLQATYTAFRQQVPLKNVLSLYRYVATQLPISLYTDEDFLQQATTLPGDILFEGAHATLLDREYGYYPYVAKTDTTTRQATQMLARTAFAGQISVLGAVRALGYRHGPGPFVTEDRRLSGLFDERHNKPNEWQGNTRYGWFDLLAARHALGVNARIDGLALTMLDHLSRLEQFRVCRSYEYRGLERHRLDRYFEWEAVACGQVKITAIKPFPTQRTDELAGLLFDCIPWDWQTFAAPGGRHPACRNLADAFVRFLESPDGLGLPVQITSTGPTLNDKQASTP